MLMVKVRFKKPHFVKFEMRFAFWLNSIVVILSKFHLKIKMHNY